MGVHEVFRAVNAQHVVLHVHDLDEGTLHLRLQEVLLFVQGAIVDGAVCGFVVLEGCGGNGVAGGREALLLLAEDILLVIPLEGK